MNRLIALAAAASTLWAASALAPTAAQAQVQPSPKAVALAKRYVTAVQAERIMENEGPAVAQFMLAKIPEPEGGPDKAKEIRKAMLESANAAVHAKLPEFLDQTALVYARVFTEKELVDIVAFFDSPAGKAFVGKTSDAAAPMAEVLRSMGGAIQSDTEQRFCAREPALCKAADAPKAP